MSFVLGESSRKRVVFEQVGRAADQLFITACAA